MGEVKEWLLELRGMAERHVSTYREGRNRYFHLTAMFFVLFAVTFAKFVRCFAVFWQATGLMREDQSLIRCIDDTIAMHEEENNEN